MQSETPKRITLSRAKGWRMPPNTVKVDRSTAWGNPYTFKPYLPAHDATGEPIEHMNAANERAAIKRAKRRAAECSVDAFRRSIETEDILDVAAERTGDHWTMTSWLRPLRGKNLACWCKPGEPCHADVLLEIANTGGTADG